LLPAAVRTDRTLRAVFDTNVVVSALVFGGRLRWLRAAWAAQAVTPVVCRETVTELLRVLAYPKFHLRGRIETSCSPNISRFARPPTCHLSGRSYRRFPGIVMIRLSSR
jgi:hypothetical protein